MTRPARNTIALACGALVALALAACQGPAPEDDDARLAAPDASVEAAPAAELAPGASAEPAPSPEAPPPPELEPEGTTAPERTDERIDAAPTGDAAAAEACPADMALVEGDYCPVVDQKCLEHHPEWLHDHAVPERCLRFQEPSRCLSKERVRLRFCMDRYEWPNEKGAIPIVLVDWYDAVAACKSAGKRLCTEDEFNFACEGEAMLPMVYGYERDATKCNIDKPYRRRDKRMAKHDKCLQSADCAALLQKLDQRAPAGSFAECVSPFGVYDLNGNVNEWVEIPGEKPPNRSGLKGGWWGPVRNRCRPTVTFHKENDWGYEAGFRCCQDAK